MGLLLTLLCFLLPHAGCHGQMAPSPVLPVPDDDALLPVLAQILERSGTYRDAEEVLLKERARGEEGRARLLIEVLWLRSDPVRRTDLLNRLGDVPRPQRVPFIDQQLGLERLPPWLFSTAAPQSLRRIARALAGQKLLPLLVGRAHRYIEAGEFIEAAGVLTLAQEVMHAESGPGPEALSSADRVHRSWALLGSRRRCVGRVFDALRPPEDRLAPDSLQLPESELATALRIQTAIEAHPGGLWCAVAAAQLLTTQPQPGTEANSADRTLLAPLLIGTQFASLDFRSQERIAPRSLIQGPVEPLRKTLLGVLERYLRSHPLRVPELLPLLGQDPGGVLWRDRRDDVILEILFHAPPIDAAAERLSWAFTHRHGSVAQEPLRYVDYLARLGPRFARPLVTALRDPDGAVVGRVAQALSPYSLAVVDQALSQADPLMERRPDELPQERLLWRQRVLSLRALFRLPPGPATPAELRTATDTALDLHRCCRGQATACDRLSLPRIRMCPAWTPLLWW